MQKQLIRMKRWKGKGPDFLAQKTPIVMAYWSAANAETAYGKTDFELQVIRFPEHLWAYACSINDRLWY